MATITEAEARNLTKEGKDYLLLHRDINENGRTCIAEWLHIVERECHSSIDDWAVIAESAANQVGATEPFIIGMPGCNTFSGKDESLELSCDHFDWIIDDDK